MHNSDSPVMVNSGGGDTSPLPPRVSIRDNTCITTTNNNNNNNTINGIHANLDHIKYLRSLLPDIPHVIESLSFTDLHNWEAVIMAALVTEDDCANWLSEFGGKTKTDWKLDPHKPLSPELGSNRSSSELLSGSVYTCVPVMGTITRKSCTAKLEMKMLAQNDDCDIVMKAGNSDGKSKQYPCLVNISFYHNHDVQSTFSSPALSCILPATVVDTPTFKIQELPGSLKEHFESFFMPSTSPVSSVTSLSPINSQLSTAPMTLSTCTTPTMSTNLIPSVNLSSMQPLSQEEIEQGQVVILPEQHVQNRIFHNEVFNLEDVSEKLSEALDLLNSMLNKSGTACAAVKQFTDHFERVKVSEEALEKALCNFGAGIHVETVLPPPPPTAPVTEVPPAGPMSSVPNIVPQWTLSVPSVPELDNQLRNSEDNLDIPANSENPNNQILTAIATPPEFKDPKKPTKSKQSKSKTTTGQSAASKRKSQKKVEHTVAPGQVDPVTGKRRKRSRCGTCQGCINRNKTQDCRVCRNCQDQKRYGGPGRLKKACVNRSCIIMATPDGHIPSAARQKALLDHHDQHVRMQKQKQDKDQTSKDQQSNPQSNNLSLTDQSQASSSDSISINLPIHPVPVPVQVSIRNQSSTDSLQTTTISLGNSNGVPQAVLSWANESDFPTAFEVRLGFLFHIVNQSYELLTNCPFDFGLKFARKDIIPNQIF